MGTLARHDMPIYRYISFERFYQMVFSRELALVSPSLWPDSYEMYWIKLLATDQGSEQLKEYILTLDGDHQQMIRRVHSLCTFMYNHMYCICFSKAKDSEVLWNARSNDTNCIMYATTPSRIDAVLPDEVGDAAVKEVFYDLDNADTQRDFFSHFTLGDGMALYGESDDLFLHKRKCFAYEEEVRLLFRPSDCPKDTVIKYPIPKLSDFIIGVMVHPLAGAEFVSKVGEICQKYGIEFWGKSSIYDFHPLV